MSKAKGSRREREVRNFCYDTGALAVLKAGASLGIFDLLALFRGHAWAIQVKSNRWPRRREMHDLEHFRIGSYLQKWICRIDDRKPWQWRRVP